VPRFRSDDARGSHRRTSQVDASDQVLTQWSADGHAGLSAEQGGRRPDQPGRPRRRRLRPCAPRAHTGREGRVMPAPQCPDPPYRHDDFCKDCEPKARALSRWLVDELTHRLLGLMRAGKVAEPDPTVTPEDTLRAAGISSKR